MYNSKIIGLGHYVPDNVVTNDDLSKLMDTSDEWIQERTGIKERRHVAKSEDTTTAMGVKAAKIAIEQAGIDKDDIEPVTLRKLLSIKFDMKIQSLVFDLFTVRGNSLSKMVDVFHAYFIVKSIER